MLTLSEVRKIINNKINEFTGIDRDSIQLINQPNFKPPNCEWCRVTVQYHDTRNVSINDGSSLYRDYGTILIQCFTPKGMGDVKVMALADKWREHWKDYGSSYFEVTVPHAPTEAKTEVDSLYVMSLVRIEFRVN